MAVTEALTHTSKVFIFPLYVVENLVVYVAHKCDKMPGGSSKKKRGQERKEKKEKKCDNHLSRSFHCSCMTQLCSLSLPSYSVHRLAAAKQGRDGDPAATASIDAAAIDATATAKHPAALSAREHLDVAAS